MSETIIFLDIDGVLNNSHSVKLPRVHTPEIDRFSPIRGADQFDKSCVECLNEILKISNAKMVVSSDWRIFFNSVDGVGFKTLSDYIRLQGVNGEIIDYTPHFYNKPRGVEIKAWLEDHLEITNILILDDINNMEDLKPYLVQTSWKHGLVKEKHFDKAIDILKKTWNETRE